MWLLWAALSSSDPSPADRRVLDRMLRGEHEALAELYDRHGRLVYSLALRTVRDQAEAEDVVQEVFSQVWRQVGRYDSSRGTVLAWLLTLTRSRSIDRLRSRPTRTDAATDDLINEIPDAAVAVDTQLAGAAQAVQVRAALEDLTTLQRVAIELAFFEGLTHSEIADRLEAPLGTIKTRIRQGLLKMRDRLAGTL